MKLDMRSDYMNSGYSVIHSNLEFDISRSTQSVVGLMLICPETLASSMPFYYISDMNIVFFCSSTLVLIILIKIMSIHQGTVLQSVIFRLSGILGLTFPLNAYSLLSYR
ncbi:unnamed protein product [Schistosoma rodhaini]|nr:unnamed protein product [Schistosoma rodhaini]